MLSYGADAAFEEAHARNVDEADIEAWLDDVADYCADNRTARLVYFHPSGIALFPGAFERWLAHTAALQQQGRLRLMTMASYAVFADRRVDVRWSLHAETGKDRAVFEATQPATLASMSWLFPMDRYGRPAVREGSAEVSVDGPYWRVVSSDAPRLVLGLEDRGLPANPSPGVIATATRTHS